MKARLLCGLLLCLHSMQAYSLPFSTAQAQEKKTIPAGTEVNVIVQPPSPEPPPLTLKLNGRDGKGVPLKCGFAHTAGGNINVQQPSPDKVVLTLTGVAVAGGHPCMESKANMHVHVNQCFSVSFEKPDIKYPTLKLEDRVRGLLRTHCCGGGVATESGQASIAPACGGEALTVVMPSNSASKGQLLKINDHEGPACVPVVPGKYVLSADFDVTVTHPAGPWRADSADFAPDPALNPIWIDYKEPFHGINKKNFGLQITITVLDDAPPSNGDSKEVEKDSGDKKPPETLPVATPNP